MRSKAITSLLVSGFLWVVAMMVWPGCATPPLPSSRKPIQSRKQADFAFAKSAQPSRSEVIQRLGEPDAYVSDLRVACYRVNEVTRREVWLCLFVIPVNVEKYPGGFDLAFLEFDEQDRLRRSGLRKAFRGSDMDSAAREWLARMEKRAH